LLNIRKWPFRRIAAAAGAGAFASLAYVYLTLPDVRPLATANPVTTAFIELRRREALHDGRTPRRVQRWVRYERISNNLRRAVLVAEDSAFWDHDGIDVEQLKASIEKNLERGQAVRGGSTITQQLAKNLYLSPARTPVRKLRELLITRRLEASLTKRRILELYLNEIEWGDGIYGAEAASRTYFNKPASALTAEEAALLAGAIVNPRVHSPAHPTARLRRRQQMILKRMGWVEPPPESPATPEPPPPPTDPGTPPVDGPTPIVRPTDAQPLPAQPDEPQKPEENPLPSPEPAPRPPG
jgi:monofunctional biosynthetic peptidoglycan transglycosylase